MPIYESGMLIESSKLSLFDKKVFFEVSRIKRGQTRTYKEIAILIGKPHAYRAVGNALNRNPFPVKIPCHRVVRSDGRLGGYKLGTEKKKSLLEKEGVFVKQ